MWSKILISAVDKSLTLLIGQMLLCVPLAIFDFLSILLSLSAPKAPKLPTSAASDGSLHTFATCAR